MCIRIPRSDQNGVNSNQRDRWWVFALVGKGQGEENDVTLLIRERENVGLYWSTKTGRSREMCVG